MGPRNGPMNPDTPAWARELSADLRVAWREAVEDRRQAAEDRRQAAEDRRQAAEDRRQAAEADKRHRREVMRVLEGAARVGVLIRQDIHALTQAVASLARALRGPGHGRPGGNGHGSRRNGR